MTLSSRNLFWLSLAGYIGIRGLSFLTSTSPVLNACIAGALAAGFFFICIKNLKVAWVLLLAEFLLGGSGHFFELFGLALRTWLVIAFLGWWVLKTGRDAEALSKRVPTVSLILFAVIVAMVNGVLHQHDTRYIIADAIPFFFLLLAYPAITLTDEWTKTKLTPLFFAAIVGMTIFCLGTLAWYAGHFGVLQDGYYHWFRDFAGGKITDMGYSFFRIVIPEQLLLVPCLLFLAAKLMTRTKAVPLWILLACVTTLLGLNLSRGYFLGLAIGLLALKWGHIWQRWLLVSAVAVGLIFGSFTVLHLGTSQGASPGWELFGVRLGSVTAPQTETSSNIRMAILPAALERIKQNPIVGSGLGATVTFVHPGVQTSFTTNQFDWGYLEMLAEFGSLGTFIIIGSILFVGYRILRMQTQKTDDASSALIAGLLSLLVINLTAPALFHVFGVLYIVLLLFVRQDRLKNVRNTVF